MFLNDFLYEVLGDALSINHKAVIRDYFRLVDIKGVNVKKLSNLMAIIQAEKLDLNALFMPNVDKQIFYEVAKQSNMINCIQGNYLNEKKNAMITYSKNCKAENVRAPYIFF